MSKSGQSATGQVALRESVREPLPGAQRVGDVDASTPIEITIVLRRNPASASVQVDPGLPRLEARQRSAAAVAADPADIAAVESYVRAQGMSVLGSDVAQRTVKVRTTAAQARTSFSVALGRYEAAGISYRGREGAVQLPTDIAERVEAVLGLDDRPQAHMRLKRGAPPSEDELPPVEQPARVASAPRAAAVAAGSPPKSAPLWPRQVAELYAFPGEVDGNGQTVAIIELGGGYRDGELAAYFTKIGVIISHPGIASYFQQIFVHDWTNLARQQALDA